MTPVPQSVVEAMDAYGKASWVRVAIPERAALLAAIADAIEQAQEEGRQYARQRIVAFLSQSPKFTAAVELMKVCGEAP